MRVGEMVEVEKVGLETLPHLFEYFGPAPQQPRIFGTRELVENPVGDTGFIFVTRVEWDLPLVR
jgi:hypothetical protein